MPILNRIRIANVSYDHKYIVDELYDTYNGANTLLNLANGSGKSVLVQMMLQPILPCRSIHGRKIDSYLTHSSAPTYLMLEWKLDRTVRPTYFMTGIAMGFSRPSDGEDTAQVKYFTFTHQYTEGNPLDISRIPLVSHNQGENGKGVVYLPYEEARQFVQKQEQEHLEFKSYAKDKKKNYQDSLREHGIFPEEWELLAKVNEKEGGVDELFSNCKTSDVLLDRWILSVVSESLTAGRGELLEMFEALMKSILDEEKSLQDKENIESFLEQLSPVKKAVEELCGELDQKERLEGLFAGLYRYLVEKSNQLEQEKNQIEDQQEEIQAELKRLKEEELSKGFYEFQENYEILYDQLEDLKFLLNERDSLCRQADHDFRACQASEHYEEMMHAQQRVASLEEQIRIFQQGEEQEDLRNVAFTLAVKYEERISHHSASRTEAEQQHQSSSSHLNSLKLERTRLQASSIELGKKQAVLNERIKGFRQKEADIFRQLGIALNRNMLGELDHKEKDAACLKLENHIVALAGLFSQLEKESQDAQEQANLLRRKQDDCFRQQADLNAKIESARRKIQDWKKSTGELQRCLERYLPGADLYSEENGAFLLQLRETWHSEENQLVRQRDRLLELLENFRRGSLHTAPAFREALLSAGIQVMTGEDYLKKSFTDEQKQMDLLQKNPMLPYCFLVARGDLKRAQAVASQEPVERICPVMALEDVDSQLAAEDHTVLCAEPAYLVCSYNWESLSISGCDGYEERLSTHLDHAGQACETLREQLRKLDQDIELVNAFPYQREDGPALERDAALLEEKQASLESQRLSFAQEEQRQRGLEQESKAAMELCGKELQKAKEQKADFDQYLAANTAHESDLQELRRATKEQEETGNRQIKLEQDYEATELDCTKLNQIIGEHSRFEQTYREKRVRLTKPDNGTLLSFEIPALEERHQTLSGQLCNDEQQLNNLKNAAAKEYRDAEKKLQNRYADLPEEDFAHLPFSEEELERRRRQWDYSKNLYDDTKQRHNKKESELDVANGRLQDSKKLLRDIGRTEPLPMSEIKNNFPARREECFRRERELKSRLAENQQSNQKYLTRQYSIPRIIDPAAYPPAEQPPEGGYELFDLPLQEKAYSALKESTSQKKNRLERQKAELEKRRGISPTIDNVLNSIRSPEAELTFKMYYFVFERLTDLQRKLEDYLNILRSALQRVETQKENVVRQAASQGRSLYRELCKINSSATIRVSKNRLPQSTLHISVPESLDGQAEDRMRNYVSQCISTARESLAKGDLVLEKMRKYLEERFSDRQLLNTVVGHPNISVKLYKVESISQNSRLKPWENIVVENSGGELFVSCFILISALISYARKRKLAQQNAAEGSKVFLIDNPFGKASSPHLLEAMIEVASKFDTQLICLSDLSQSSITQQFDLIYQLSMRKAAYSNQSYLKTDELKNNADLHTDSRLEHVSVYCEQMSLL